MPHFPLLFLSHLHRDPLISIRALKLVVSSSLELLLTDRLSTVYDFCWNGSKLSYFFLNVVFFVFEMYWNRFSPISLIQSDLEGIADNVDLFSPAPGPSKKERLVS